MNTSETDNHFVTIKQARKAQFEVFKNQYTDHEELKKIIKEIIHDKIDITTYDTYWIFRHKEYKQKIKERFCYLNKRFK